MAPDLDPLFARFQEALAGKYSLERELGRGGMGVVFLAYEVRLERPVAIKLLPPHLACQSHLRERFLREARTAARLSHPNIVPIHAVDEIGDLVYYVMAYVPGETLARRVETQGPLPAAEASRILREVAWAVAYSHAQGVVHRDIKPENVMLEQGSGRAMVADFGIAAVERATRETAPGQLLGTPEFMSPEQASGDAVDGRSDLYAVGALGYYLLTGNPPYQGPTAAKLLSQHLTAPVPSLAAAAPGLPVPLVQVLERCLAKEPDQRPQSGEQLAEALGGVMEVERGPSVALRAFLRRFKMSMLTGGLVSLGPALVITFPTAMGFESRAIADALIWAAITAVFLVYSFEKQLRQLRGLSYRPGDVAEAADIVARSRSEEDSFLAGWDPSRSPKAAWGTLWLFAFLFLMRSVPMLFTSQIPTRLDFFFVLLYAAGLIVQIGVVRSLRHSSEAGPSLTGRFWRSRFVQWYWRRIGGDAVAATPAISHRPTEIRLGQSVDELFAALPLETRRELKGLLPLVRRLEPRTQRIRGWIEELDRLLGQVGRAAEDQATGPKREAAIEALTREKALAVTRLEEVVAALETIRLNLLRLRAGSGTLQGITADLAAAEEIAAHTERQLAGRAEVERMLKEGGQRGGGAEVTDSSR